MDTENNVMSREAPEDIDPARKAKVDALTKMVQDDLKHWAYAYKRMRSWRNFARGLQWPGSTKEEMSDADRAYVANITMRHLKQRTASIYAKNPKYLFRKTRKINSKRWDGTAQSLQQAAMMVDAGADLTGENAAILQDAINSRSQSMVLDKIGQTMTYLYQYFVREQIPPTKAMMKRQVLSSLTCGAAYIKQTFHRATDYPAEVAQQLQDSMKELEAFQRLSADLADGEFDENDVQAEELRLVIAQLEDTEKLIIREGLALDYPDATNIIPDMNMTHLPGFIGCGHVTEQYDLTADQIKEVYHVDVSKSFTQYDTNREQKSSSSDDLKITGRVWEIWSKRDNLIYTICEGYPDYLEEPFQPITYTERFWPWFVYAPNAVDDPDDPFPPSDVELIMTQQMEINRSGEALRDHRWAARPGHVSGSNLSEPDAAKIKSRKPHDIIILQGLGPDEDIKKKFQDFPTSAIDPNLYNTSPSFTDILRSVGSQEANLGGTSNSTATESSIAESSRQSTVSSAIDELDDMLTEMARHGGQLLLQEMSPEKVAEIVGPGAVWPEQTREQIAEEIYLEVVAGSSGRPNQAQEVQVRERIYPLIFQIPGVKMEKMAKDLLQVLDDSIDYEDWIDMDMLPVVAMNGQMQAQANRGDGQSGQSGGASNAKSPPEPSNTGAPRPGQAMPGGGQPKTV